MTWRMVPLLQLAGFLVFFTRGVRSCWSAPQNIGFTVVLIGEAAGVGEPGAAAAGGGEDGRAEMGCGGSFAHHHPTVTGDHFPKVKTVPRALPKVVLTCTWYSPLSRQLWGGAGPEALKGAGGTTREAFSTAG